MTAATACPRPRGVTGRIVGPPSAPVVLVYGHYDVQPVDPAGARRHHDHLVGEEDGLGDRVRDEEHGLAGERPDRAILIGGAFEQAQ